MNSTNNTLVVNAGSAAVTGKSTISGTLKLKSTLQTQCEEILRRYEKGNVSQARKEIRLLLEKNPDSMVVKQLDVLILYRDGKYAQAYEKIKKILKKAPRHAGLINLQGLIQRNLEKFNEAASSYKQAIKLKPDLADPYNNLAIIYRYFGERELAIEYFRKAITKNKDYSAAFYNLSCIKGYKATNDELKDIESLIKKLKNNSDIVRCHFALYNAYTSRGEDEKAFHHLQLGNHLNYRSFRKSKPLQQYAKEIKNSFTVKFYKERASLQPFSKTPFFIVGMPRSGSSLLEQILSSHPKVCGLGESKTILDMLADIQPQIDSNLPLFIEKTKELNFVELSNKVKKYQTVINSNTEGFNIYTDKMLKNFKYIGFIKILLPNAKFIHIKRNALDNCFSCYERKFSRGHEYCYDLSILGEYYSAYIDLLEYWKTLFPEDIHEVKYEELILDNENIISRCLNFMNLEMDKSCLEYYKSDRNVYTASTDQVKEKIHTRSIGKWKKYERHLQPLIEELKKNNIALE